jgi:thiosulfate reductase cytochrome b subunit
MRDLGTGRNWHFFFAWALVLNGAVYLAFNIFNRHFQRDILPKTDELKPAHLWEEVVHHAQFKRITGAAAKNYNTLQKLAYVAVIFVLFPLIILTGLTMSPGFNAIAPILLDIFGGRQSARSLHFIAANLLVAFLVIHLIEVVVAGAWNEIRSMITGKFVVPQSSTVAEDAP